MGTIAASDTSFEQEVLKAGQPVLVDFWAPWCGPCKALGPVLEEAASDLTGTAKIVKVNIDENPETPSKYRIRSIPTLMLFKNGALIDTKVGGMPKSALIDWVRSNL